MRIGPVAIDKIFNSTDMSATITGNAINISSSYVFAIILKWIGATAAGTIDIQFSNSSIDNASQIPTDSWITETGFSQVVLGPGEKIYNLSTLGYRWVRFIFTQSGGTGTITVAGFNSKGV